MRNKQLEAIAEDILLTLRDMHEDEQIFFCPSSPDKCGGCEINPEAIKMVVSCLEWAAEQEEDRRDSLSY